MAAIGLFAVLNTNCSRSENPVYAKEKVTITENSAYKNQMAFVLGGDTKKDFDFILNHDLYKKMEDTKVSWTYFDKLSSSSLQTSLKQELSYIVLCKKDLISLVNKNHGNVALITALKKHVAILVESDYMGYTSLYYALEALNNAGETDFVNNKAKQIATYAKYDPFNPDIIKAGPKEAGSQKFYDQIVDNFGYVSKIQTL